MNHQHPSTFAFPSDLSDHEAVVFCDFLFQLAADADAHYLAQILRYRHKNNPPPQHPNQPWRSKGSDF